MGALNFYQGAGARVLCQYLPPEYSLELITPHRFTRTVNHPDPVGIAVEGYPEVSVGFPYPPDKVLKIADLGRIRVMAGKISVRLEE